MLIFAVSLLANLDAVLVCTRSGELPKVLGDLSSLTVLDVSHNQLTGALIAPILSGLVLATDVDVVFTQVLCQRCFQLRLRFSICRVRSGVRSVLLTRLLVEFRLNGAL